MVFSLQLGAVVVGLKVQGAIVTHSSRGTHRQKGRKADGKWESVYVDED